MTKITITFEGPNITLRQEAEQATAEEYNRSDATVGILMAYFQFKGSQILQESPFPCTCARCEAERRHDDNTPQSLWSMKKTWLIYLQYGHGTMESPYREGKSLGTFSGTEAEVQQKCRAMMVEKYGPKLTSWEDPSFAYKELSAI